MPRKMTIVNAAVATGAVLSAMLFMIDPLVQPWVSAFSPLPPSRGASAVVRGRNFENRGFTHRNRFTIFPDGKPQPCWVIAANSGRLDQSDHALATKTSLTATTAPPFSLPLVLEECPMHIPDPEVRETDTGYSLTFKLPAEVTAQDGLDVDVTVSGRLLTIEARTTRKESHDISSEPAGGYRNNDRGWVIARSASRTLAAARSFTLPDGVSNEVTASWGNGQVEINLSKVAPDDWVSKGRTNDLPSSTMEDSGVIPIEHRDDKRSIPSSAAEGHLSGLKGRLRGIGLYPSSILLLDLEFRDLVKAMWTGDDAVKFPTEEQVAATVERARKERKKRVRALRRAMMATDVTEEELAYVIKVALPNGATRDHVKLMVMPDDSGLRVTFSADGNHTISKAVCLPSDALFSEISAAFTPEPRSTGDHVRDSGAGGGGGSGGGGRKRDKISGKVSDLEVTVGKAAPRLPKSIEIK